MKKRLRFFYVIMLVGLAACLFSCNFFIKPEDNPEKTNYTVTFNANDGSSNPKTAVQTFEEGIEQKLKTVSVLGFKREDYTVKGWAKKADTEAVEYLDGAAFTATSDITLYAVWTPEIVNVSYTVEHYKQNINDDGYTKIDTDTQTLSGIVGEKTKAIAKTYIGFTAKAFEQKTLSKKESNIIKIYYDRDIITWTFNADGGNWADGKTELSFSGKYGADFSEVLETPVKSDENADYNFYCWYPAIPQIFEENLTFTALWNIDKKLCKIEHFIQNLDDDGYTKVEADTQNIKLPLMRVSSEVPDDYIKEYEGFRYDHHVLNAQSNIEYYYDRKITSLTLNANGGQFAGGEIEYSLSRKFGSKIVIHMGESAWPSYSGFILKGWAHSRDAATTDYPQELSFEVTAETSELVTLYAVWEPEANLNNSGLNFDDLGNDVEIIADGNIYKAITTLQGTYCYEWYLNDVKQDCEENSIDLSQLPAGYYILTVKVTNTDTGFVYVSTFDLPIVF
ncbi:InlB B-repeat-containing protein [Treponema bryantii]|uniref:InlB B-repeat-containing protein n=1 Tax=Treponema bryantii TaxID=163 RepID=UPI002B310FE0|nr:hypothetical protein TRBR_09630 [Treponema bryantii]